VSAWERLVGTEPDWRSLRYFAKRLSYDRLVEAMEVAAEKYGIEGDRFPYFAGIAHNWIRNGYRPSFSANAPLPNLPSTVDRDDVVAQLEHTLRKVLDHTAADWNEAVARVSGGRLCAPRRAHGAALRQAARERWGGGRARGMNLVIELVPRPLWGRSLAQLMPRYRWQKLRAEILKRDGERCSVCASETKPLICDEVWDYEDAGRVAHLRRLRIICRMCSFVKHFGHAGTLAQDGRLDLEAVIEHFCRVNACDRAAFEQHRDAAGDVWLERSRRQQDWTVDFGEYASRL
jgi:hypothetical protein